MGQCPTPLPFRRRPPRLPSGRRGSRRSVSVGWCSAHRGISHGMPFGACRLDHAAGNRDRTERMADTEPLTEVLAEFARTMVTDFPIQAFLDHLVERIVEVLPVSAAGVTLISPGATPVHVPASNTVALRSEGLQSELGEGACVEAYGTGEPVPVDDVESDARFARFTTTRCRFKPVAARQMSRCAHRSRDDPEKELSADKHGPERAPADVAAGIGLRRHPPPPAARRGHRQVGDAPVTLRAAPGRRRPA